MLDVEYLKQVNRTLARTIHDAVFPGDSETIATTIGWVVCATTGSLCAVRVKTLLVFGEVPTSVHRRTAIHTR